MAKKPSSFGKRNSFAKTTSASKLGKPHGLNKQGEAASNVDVSHTHLETLRRQAERNARSALSNADMSPGALEEGYLELYYTDTGEILRLSGSNAGRGYYDSQGEAHFEYSANNYTARPFWVLVWGHSHPARNRGEPPRSRRGLSRNDEGLLETAPVYIKYGANNYFPHRGRNYQQFS